MVSGVDTDRLLQALQPCAVPEQILSVQGSGESPIPQQVLTIEEIYERTLEIVGTRLPAVGAEQDRVRGEQLQEVVTMALGLARHNNQSQWPDILSQALEVKLQTSPTVDLGLVLPSDTDPAPALGPTLRHCDARYLIAYGKIGNSGETEIAEIVVVTGEDFFTEFVQFGGLVKSSKRQIRLPPDLFNA